MLPLRTTLFLATALVAVPMTIVPFRPATAQIGISVTITEAPPPLPVYDLPPLPAEGWLWTPGFWSYGPDGYYWVPGTWVEPPQPGLLWTPGYWGYNNGEYVYNEGYWGPHVGFYGGINYGYGYNGVGFFGGEWRGGVFAYNRAAISNFGDVHVTNVYNQTFVDNHVRNVSFNGGPRGIDVRPTAEQQQYAHETHIPRTSVQNAHIQAASQNRELLAKANGGHPPIAATQRPNEFSGKGVVAAHDAPAHPAAAERPVGAVRPGETSRPGEAAKPAEATRPGETARPTEGTRPGTEASRPGVEAGHPRPEATRPATSEAEHRSTTATRPAASTVRHTDTARPAAEAPREGSLEARPQAPARPEASTRPEAVARPEAAARPEPAARPEAATRPEPAARPAAPPAVAPRPAEARPASRPAEPHRDNDKPKK